MNPKGPQLYLKPEEAKFLGMAVASMIEQLEEGFKNPKANWNPEARKTFRDMLAAGNLLRIKLRALGIDVRPLPPFIEGDEEEFLTKPS